MGGEISAEDQKRAERSRSRERKKKRNPHERNGPSPCSLCCFYFYQKKFLKIENRLCTLSRDISRTVGKTTTGGDIGDLKWTQNF
jgi:hypothetical protein